MNPAKRIMHITIIISLMFFLSTARDSIYNAGRYNISSILSKIQRRLAIHGILGIIKLCLEKANRYILWFTPSHRRNRAVAQNRDLEFDRKWGVDTSGDCVPDKSQVVGSNWVYGIKYEGCDSTALYEILSEFTIRYEHFTFVDLGSGKGRALLVSSRFPFRRIIGVEYSEQLNEIARYNISRFPKAEKRCREIDIVCDDAARFPIPQGPLVIFLYHPFVRPVMKEIVKNVLMSFQQDPRRIIVLYCNAVFADMWKNCSFIEEIRVSKGITIYDSQVRKASISA